MSGELKPCPFCGSPGHLVDEPRVPTMAMVMCGKDCELMPQTEWHEREEAIRRWNTRTTPSQGLDPATVERCKDAAKRAVELYADSYAQMGRDSQGDGRVDYRSVEVDLRRNVVESVTRAIALATDPHQHGGKGA